MPSILRRGLALAVYAAVLAACTGAAPLGKECDSNSDCAAGATCVAGDSEQAVQRCVAGTPCGGSVLGACPSDEVSGQLACIWRQDAETCASSPGGCTEIGGELGIYKCISLDRCDEYFSGQCSSSCNVNGKQCNGRGTCQLTGETATKPTFECVCDSGWNGTLCNNVVNDTCVVDAGQCGDHGTCVSNACKCANGYSGDQCQISPTSLSSSGSSDSSGSSSKSPSSVPSPTPSTSNTQTSSASRANSGETITKNSSGPSALVIIMAVLVALIVVAAILFVVIARKRRREQEAADAGGFNRTDSVIAGDIPRAGPPTPKGKIVIM